MLGGKMKTELQTILAGIGVVLGCLLFFLWTVYLYFSDQIATKGWYGPLASAMWFVMMLYFCGEVRKDVKEFFSPK